MLQAKHVSNKSAKEFWPNVDVFQFQFNYLSLLGAVRSSVMDLVRTGDADEQPDDASEER